MTTISSEVAETVKAELSKVEGVNGVETHTVPSVMTVHTQMFGRDEATMDRIYAVEKQLRQRFPAVSFDFFCIYENGV